MTWIQTPATAWGGEKKIIDNRSNPSHATYERIADKCEDLEKNISVTNGTKFFQTKEVQI